MPIVSSWPRVCKNPKCDSRTFDSFRFSKENVSELHVGTPKTHRRSTQNQPTGVFTHPRPISDVPNYIGSSTWSLKIFLRTFPGAHPDSSICGHFKSPHFTSQRVYDAPVFRALTTGHDPPPL